MIILTHKNGPLRDQKFRSPLTEIRLGRESSCDLTFEKENFDTVSRHHATIRFDGTWYLIEDKSKHGTAVNSQRVGAQTYLREGDIIQLGGGTGPKLGVHFRYKRKKDEDSSKPVKSDEGLLFGVPKAWVFIFGGMGLLTLLFAAAMLVLMGD